MLNPARRDAAVIVLVALAHVTSHIFHLLLPPLFPFLMPEFGFGYAEAGFLMTVFFTVSGVGQAFAGIAVDRYGARRVLMAGISMLALSGVAVSVAGNYPMLVVSVALAGMGNAIFHPADFSLLNKKVSPSRLGYAFSVHGLAGSLGWALGAAMSGAALVWWGWRMAGLSAAAIAALSLVALFFSKSLLDDDVPRVDASGNVASGQAAVKDSTFGFLGIPVIWLAFCFFLLVTAAFGGLQSFSAPVLGGMYGLTPAAAVAALTAYLLGAAGGTLAGGFVATRVARHDRLVARALGAAAAVAVVLASGLPSAWSVMPLMTAIGVGVGLAGPSRDLLVRRAATDAASSGANSPAFGRIYGFVYSGLDVGLALGPVAFGLLLDAGGRDYVLPGIAMLQIFAVLTVLTMGGKMQAPITATAVSAGR